MKRINLKDPNWPSIAQQRAALQDERKKRNSASRAATKRVRTRAYLLSLDTLGTIHNAQHGRCANTGCNAAIKATGRGRALDPISNKMLCKGCSVMLSIANRDRQRLAGLLTYTEMYRG